MLPPELWLVVFRWATCPLHGYPAPYYEPFRASSEAFDLRTKHALVRVCRLWRALATAYLYEDVRFGRDLGALKSVLTDRSLARFVRRIELPYSFTATRNPEGTRDVVEILAGCTSLETLVRPFFDSLPYSVPYEFPADTVSLSSLTRLEWWHYNNAARSGGINSLIDVLRNAPSLQFLSLGGEFWMNSMQPNILVRLPALTTLRLKRMNALFLWQIKRWELPSLVHVIVDFPPDQNGLGELWLHFGTQLCTVEFGQNVAFFMTDQISVLLRGCPAVKVFNYFVNFTAPPTECLLVEHRSLQCIGIHAFPCDMLDDGWEHLSHHFDFLSDQYLPALKRIVLYGNWDRLLVDSRVSALFERLAQQGRTVVCARNLQDPACDHLGR